MRIAVTMGTLRIPPTYFAVQHTGMLAQSHEVRTLALTTNIRDASVADGALDIVDVVPWRRASFRTREITMPLVIGKMTRDIIRFHPDVVHQHFATWSTSAVNAARALGAPMVVTVHGADVFAALRSGNAVSPAGRPMLAWHHWNVRRVFRASARVLAVSGYIADKAVQAGASADKVEVHYQGVDTEYFTPGVGQQAEQPVVLFVGALSQAKGLPDLIEASIAIVGTHPHRLHLVGSGPLLEVARHAAEEHRHIAVLGTLSREEVREQLRAADVMVLPAQESNGAREAAGLVLLEAQACGTPVIAYASGGTPEMMMEGETGFAVVEGNRSALSGALRNVLSFDAGTRESFSAAAREFVVGHRSLSASVRELEAHYRDVV